MMIPVASLIAALFGLSIGSLLNVCIDRIPAGESIVRPPSHCSSCNKRLSTKDLIPVFSYLLLRGRCRHCGVKIPIRILVVELTTAFLFGLITWHFLSHDRTSNALIIIPIIYTCIFIVIFFIDLEKQIIIIPMIFTGAALSLIFSLFWDGFGAYWPQSSISNTYLDGMASALLGGTTGTVFMMIPYFIARAYYKSEGIGQGDIYLAALIGLATGFPLVLVSLIIGIIIGGITAISLVASRRKKKRDMIPFGPFLVIGAIITLMWGTQILSLYSGLFPAS